jgi:hypothetical protein
VALRFRALGRRQYVTLPDGTDQVAAAGELERVLARVKLGIWKPPEPEPVAVKTDTDPSFHEFASCGPSPSRSAFNLRSCPLTSRRTARPNDP